MTDTRTGRTPPAVGIKALDLAGISGLVSELGVPAYRASQLVRWLYGRAVRSYEEMTDLPAALRAGLAERLPLPFPAIAERQLSADGTRKYLLELADGTTVEAVGLPAGDRLTVCFSTQAGCAMGCAFCATGASGFSRDLGPGEMADQINVVAEDFGRRVTNAVAMGQGEPFAAYDATLGALRILNSPDGPGIGARHLTVSTCGLVSGIDRLATEPEQFTLAVSLHSAIQVTRDQLMPGVKGVALPRLRESLAAYAASTGRRPTLEYSLMAGVNDTPAELDALVEFCRGLLVHVNLIPVNPVEESGFSASPPERIAEFAEALKASGTEASVRAERGADIDAACGQLRRRGTSHNPPAIGQSPHR